QPDNVQSNIFLTGSQHPWFDAYWQPKQIGSTAAQIDVPVLGCLTWQDDEVGSRPAWTFFRNVNPSLLWLIASNGSHGMCDRGTPSINAQVLRFFDRFVLGASNGFDRMPHVQIWHEARSTLVSHVSTSSITITSENTPSWVSTFRSWPPRTATTPLYLRTD